VVSTDGCEEEGEGEHETGGSGACEEEVSDRYRIEELIRQAGKTPA